MTDWLAAAPLVLGASLPVTLAFNFSLWSLIFVLLVFVLFIEIGLRKNLAALGAFLVCIPSYYWILRPVSLQEVFPFFLLFLLAGVRWYRNPERRGAKIFLAVTTASTFYIYAYLWQIAVSALLVLLVVLIARRDWSRLQGLAIPAVLSFVFALPAFLYTLAQVRNPYFWQTAERITLVYTHLPTAEVVYSGGWIAFTLLVFFLVRRRIATEDLPSLAILSVLGIALVGVQASNAVTGREMETAVHVRHFIVLWLGISFGALVAWLSRCVPHDAKWHVRWAGYLLVGAVLIGNLYFVKDFPDFFSSPTRDARTQNLQTLAAPFQYLEQAEQNPIVVWVTDPESDFALYLPALTKHYVLYTHPGMWHLVSNDEIRERYLAANYLHSVTKESLITDLGAYAGPAAAWHRVNTVNRGVRLCEMFRLDILGYSCGEVVTTEELLGEEYFNDFLSYNTNEVRSHIRELLVKYHVTYLASPKPLGESERDFFGAQLVYDDQRYAIYRIATVASN